MQEMQVWSLAQEDPLKRKWQSTPLFLPGKSHGQRSLAGYSPWACRIGRDWATNRRRQWQPTPVLLPGKSHGQRSLLGCSPWGCEESWLSNYTFTFHFHALEKERATHSSVLSWRIPGTEEPGGLSSMGLCRVGQDWRDLEAAAAAALKFLLSGTTYLWGVYLDNYVSYMLFNTFII